MIIEGAGSPAELNLRAGDIVNMAVARHAQSPVLLVGDIDKGGIFAQLLGTLWLLEPEERALVRGLIVNKFRGDPALFVDGVRILEERRAVPVLGVVPWVPRHGIPEEDAAGARYGPDCPSGTASIDIAVIALPRIANFDDFDPLAQEAGGARTLRARRVDLGRPDAIILPGTKHTLADLAWLRQSGLAEALLTHAGRGGALVGICGGYQMLGSELSDPAGVEGGGDAAGLDLLPVNVVFGTRKETWQAQATLRAPLPWFAESGELLGYEIHAGHALSAAPMLHIRRPDGETVADGACSADGRIWGTHLHGLFQNDDFRRAWLTSLGWHAPGGPAKSVRRGLAAYDALADVLEANLDLARLDAIIGP